MWCGVYTQVADHEEADKNAEGAINPTTEADKSANAGAHEEERREVKDLEKARAKVDFKHECAARSLVSHKRAARPLVLHECAARSLVSSHKNVQLDPSSAQCIIGIVGCYI